jgi:tetratricopeptide (TPR) repeat protein
VAAGRDGNLMWRTVVVCTLLVGATIAVYGQALRFDFVAYDDPQYVTEHARVRGGLTAEGLAWAFSGEHLGNWHPLTSLSYMLDAELHGVSSRAFHFTNVVLHVLNTLLLLAVLRSMTGAFYRSALVAALFALHPLHVESVAWVSERKDVLSTFFGFLSMALYVAYARRGGPGRYLLAALLLALSLMAKPMLVTLPVVFLLLDYWPLGRIEDERAAAGDGRVHGAARSRWGSDRMGPLVLEKLPFLALSFAASLVTIMVQRPASIEAVPVPLRLANALVSYVRYILKAVWPSSLGPLYPHPNLPGGVPWAAWQVAGAAVLLAAVTILAIGARRRPYVLVGWLWYLGTLVPVIGLVQVGPQAMADRYTYVPLIGLFLVAVWGCADLVGERHVSSDSRRLVPRMALAASGLLLAALAARAWDQARHWRSSLALFSHAVEVAPTSAVMHTSLGVVLDRQGETDEAVQHYRRALVLDPQFPAAHTNLGIVLYKHGKVDEALRYYREALRLEPDSAKAHNNLGVALQARDRRGQQDSHDVNDGLDEAIEHYRRSLEIDPGFAEAHNNLAFALQRLGKLDEAIHHYREALRVLPAVASIHAHLAGALYAKHMVDEAIGHYRLAVQLGPGDAVNRNNLGYLLHARGQAAEAIVEYEQALAVHPQYAEARNNLGLALVDTGRIDDAIAQYRLALEIRPDYVNAHVNLGAALHARGEIEEAIAHYRRALDLRPGYALAQANLERALRRRDATTAAGAEASGKSGP